MEDSNFNPYTILSVPRDAGPQAIDTAWAKNLKLAQRKQIPIPLANLNKARANLKDPETRVAWDLSHPFFPLDSSLVTMPEPTLTNLGFVNS
jgi:hypothetical protein